MIYNIQIKPIRWLSKSKQKRELDFHNDIDKLK